MILPTKYLPYEESLLGVVASLLPTLPKPGKSVSFMKWRKKVTKALDLPWNDLVLSLDVLYLMNLVDYVNGCLVRVKK